jgi:chromosome segregation protein
VYLKRLEIKGFKSFADNTDISLKPGINILVGPNGCGKSNIVDAIRWVLGESNIRNLRGNKSEDVIFNGTDTRKSLGMAQVEMELDNADQLIPLDYSNITLNRKIFRNGESEFYINKSRVRMKDISNLFTGTGLGKKGYSIISQGELEQVLNGQALDRRLILEEASGLIKYRQQRNEVKHRLESTDNNLLRLGDILAEVKGRQEELSNKAVKAKRYLQLSQECQQAEKKVLSSEIVKIKQELAHKNEELLQQQERMTLLQEALSEQEKILNICEEEQKLQQQQLNKEQAAEHRNQEKLTQLQGEYKLGLEKIKNREERIIQSQADKNKYTDMLSQLNQDLVGKEKDYHSQEAGYKLMVSQCEDLQNEITRLEGELNVDQELFNRERRGVFIKTQEETCLKNEVNEFANQLKQLNEKRYRYLIRMDEYKKKAEQYNNDCESLQNQVEGFQCSLLGNDEKLEVLNKSRKEITKRLNKAEEDLARLNQEGIIINSSLKSIKQMNQNLTGYSAAVKSLMKASDNGRVKGILGILGEFIEVPPGLELAVEIAIGRGLEYIVADSVENVRQAIKFLKANKLGRITFLPLDILKLQRVPDKIVQQLQGYSGVIGLASQVVSYDSYYTVAVEYLLGKVLIVQDLNKAINVFKNINYPFRMVSIDGDVINVSGAISGGTKPTSYNNSPLRRKGEEKSLLQKQDENNRAKASIENQLNALKAELEMVENNFNELNQERLENKMALEIRQKQVNDTLISLDTIIKEMGVLQEKVGNMNNEIIRIQSDMEDKEQKFNALQKQNEAGMAQLEKKGKEIDLKQRDIEVRRERFSSLKEQLIMKRRELDSTRKNIAQFEQIRHSYSQSVQETEQVCQNMAELNRQDKQRCEELRQEIDKLKADIAFGKQTISRVKKAYEECSANIKQLRLNLIPVRDEVQDLEKKSRSLELTIARLETELSAQKAKWQEKFHDIPLDSTDILNYEQIKESKLVIEQLLMQLETLGQVDTDVIDEYEVVNERFQFLNQQYQDLLNARDSLKKLLGESEKLMLKNFSHFFKIANESFSQTFKAIFEGGNACLSMEKGKELLEAGVDIEVKLPGKRAQVLNLLSGGERALTCIAFIFALLRLKPAPFCLLDEIDAALDEVNLIRFTHFLQGMAEKMQFIIITHRQATISIGENIYGITMPEKGISSILTLNFKEAGSLAG